MSDSFGDSPNKISGESLNDDSDLSGGKYEAPQVIKGRK